MISENPPERIRSTYCDECKCKIKQELNIMRTAYIMNHFLIHYQYGNKTSHFLSKL